MAGETWDEVRYFVLNQIPEINRKIDGLDNKLNAIETKFEANMAILTTKMGTATFVTSAVVSLIVTVLGAVIVYWLGVK